MLALNDMDEKTLRFLDEDEFKYLKFDWYSHDDRLKAIAHRLAEQWKDEKTPSRRSKRPMEQAFNIVLTALEVSGIYVREQIRIPIYNAIYCGETQRSPTHTSEVYDALLWLKDSDYLLKTDGRRIVQSNGGGNIELPFAYTIGEKWHSAIGVAPLSSAHLITRNHLSPYVQVRTKIWKNKKKKAVKANYKPTQTQLADNKELIDSSNRILQGYDKLMLKTVVKLGDKPIFPQQTTYTRVFNNAGFEDGGRFYCALQGIKSQQRLDLSFNNEPVVEIDYTGMHPTMLYELEGLIPHPAPYDVEGFERGDVKVAFNILINRDKKKHTNPEAQSIQSNLGITHSQAQQLRDNLYEMHQPIAHRFNEGFGLKLQKIDSDIALRVMDLFVNTLKRPILMVHDSALVSVRDAESLLLCMRDDYWDAIDQLSTGTSTRVFNADDGCYERVSGFFSSGNGVKIQHKQRSRKLTALLERSLAGEDIPASSWDLLL